MSSPLAMPDVFHIYDTTLRDGNQQEGMHLSVTDKLRIARLLDELGINFIEGGWPAMVAGDEDFFKSAATELELRNAKLVAYGRTREPGLTCENDPALAKLVEANTEVVCLVAKAHDVHVYDALRTTLEENLAMVDETVRYLVGLGKRVFVDLEHFFDGYKANPTYAMAVLRKAAEAGAEVVVLCDTNGGMLPHDMGDIVSAATQVGVDLGVHCQNDSGCAVANSMSALDAGVMHVQGTINGYGERSGNVDLTTVIANLQLKYKWQVISPGQLGTLTSISNSIAEIAHQPLNPRQPFVGHSAFAHKAGLHAKAVQINENLYQHVDPRAVGNSTHMVISEMASRASVQVKGEELGLDLSDRKVADQVAELVKQRESKGYSYDLADASFELLVLDYLDQLELPFQVVSWKVVSEDDGSEENSVSEASVKLIANGLREGVISVGNGPVNALGQALVQALSGEYPFVKSYSLTDYKVRILDMEAGTDAVVRVMIVTTDGETTWTTLGVGTDVIEASWEALADAYHYGLMKGYGSNK